MIVIGKISAARARHVGLALLWTTAIGLGIGELQAGTADFRQFDPLDAARRETRTWQAYYAKQRLRLFFQIASGLRNQYQLPFWRSHLTAWKAARSAFIFKKGRNRQDYSQALPALNEFFADIKRMGQHEFDVQRAAKLELEWWIIHRQRDRHSQDDLAAALAATAAEFYGIPAAGLMDYARLRTQAMCLRDQGAAAGTPTNADWEKIELLLQESWTALFTALNPGDSSLAAVEN
jgi:hypothetical protein